MSEPGGQEYVDAPKERGCLPITKEAADRALGRIAEDPEGVLVSSMFSMGRENPQLMRTADLAGDFGVNRNIVSESVAFTYAILDEQAKARGGSVPQVSPDTYSAYLQDKIKQAQDLKAQNPQANWTDSYRGEMERISSQEPALGEAVKDLAKYRSGRAAFYMGVVDTYNLVHKTEEAARMEQQHFGE